MLANHEVRILVALFLAITYCTFIEEIGIKSMAAR
jgi:hypothetical protein